MKKIVTVFCVLISVFFMFNCGNGSDGGTSSSFKRRSSRGKSVSVTSEISSTSIGDSISSNSLNSHPSTSSGLHQSSSNNLSSSESLNSSSNVQNVGQLVFALKASGNKYSVSQGTFCGEVLDIPSYYLGFPVTEISNFSGNNHIKKIVIPETIETISSGAFNDCVNVEEIVFNAINCKDLAYNEFESEYPAFDNCGKNGTGIRVTIGNKVTRIPRALFCPSEEYSVSLAPKIISVTFQENSVCKEIGMSAFMSNRTLTNIRLPDSIRTINNEAFYGTGFTEIELPNNLETLGHRSFSEISYISEIVIPENLISIGDSVFYGCENLKKVYYNAIDCDSIIMEIGPFYNCYVIGVDVIIGKQVKTLPDRLFRGMYYGIVSKFNIVFEQESQLENMGNSIFSYCEVLNELVLPKTIDFIKEKTFDNATINKVVIQSENLVIEPKAFKTIKSDKGIEFTYLDGWKKSLYESFIVSSEITISENPLTNLNTLNSSSVDYYIFRKV